MDGITAEQLMEGLKSWKPGKNLQGLMENRLRMGGSQAETASEMASALLKCYRGTYDYIQYINELASTLELERNNFILHLARLGGLVAEIRDGGKAFQDTFQRYDVLIRPELTHDHFDTVYYDAIQALDIRALLKKILDEVEVILQAFPLVSSDLAGISFTVLYETSVRFQLYLRYFLNREKFSKEELWSVLFDFFNQLEVLQSPAPEPTEEELNDLGNKIKGFRTN